MDTKQPSDRIERLLESKHRRRLANEDRFLARQERLEQKAESMVGTLCREGRLVHYVFPVGGKYREGTRIALVQFLIRNHYVTTR